jgi:predicted nucleic acid-binding protein
LQTFDGIHERAWQLATEFGRPTAYDTHYLALAEHLGCPFWTADQRLFNAVSDKLEWVHFLGDFK